MEHLIDRKKVISTLEEIKTQTEGIGLDSAVIAHKFIDKIIALLKEQPEIVRCKDCKNNNQCSIQFKFADADNPGDWFCAYGKRT